jgi:phosphatidylserine/phosphatidylglycerophosphate/cardiolipin synthase-like enzyme
MHNKFIVLDSDRVWTGSANFSATCLGASYNANVSIEINSPALAQVYRREFAQMFTQRLFSTSKKQAVREVPTINYKDGSQIRALFSPQDDTIGRGILPFINQARTKLDVAMFYLTEEAVANAMIAARRRGVQVRLIIDAVGAGNQASKHYMLRDAGIHVRVENWGGKMHMKSAVADGKHTIIGSMNWTFTGNARNDENILLIYNNSRLATEMSDYFESLWETIPEDQVARSLRPESEYSTNSCSDGADNDHDQLIDAEDPECQ